MGKKKKKRDHLQSRPPPRPAACPQSRPSLRYHIRLAARYLTCSRLKKNLTALIKNVRSTCWYRLSNKHDGQYTILPISLTLGRQCGYHTIGCFVDYSLRRYLRSNEGAFVAVSVDYHFPPWMEHVADSLSTVLRRRKERR